MNELKKTIEEANQEISDRREEYSNKDTRLSVEKKFEIETEKGEIKEIKILLTRNVLEVYDSQDVILNVFTYRKNISDTMIGKISKVLVDMNYFEKLKDARTFFMKKKWMEELTKLKETLNLKYKIKSQSQTSYTILKIDNYSDNVNLFYKNQPFFYDKSKIFWMWNLEEFCWEIVDETDVLINIDTQLRFGGQLVSNSIKASYLEAFKQIGRKNIPKDVPKTWVQFRDRIFEINNGEVRKATPEYFSCNPIPWDIGETSDTPVMDKLFKEWVGEKYYETLYEIIAYSCLQDYPIHLIFCLVGCGRNGKSQYQKIIQRFFSSHNICSTELDLLIDNRFESAKLFKKLVCTLGETNFGVMSKTSLLKKLTGGDLIGYEFKNKMPFDDINYAKIIINSNALPSSLDTSEGFYRRWMILEFPNEFEEGKDIINSIPEIEYNNLARKVTEILPDLLKRGKFTNQGTIAERKKAYIMASNPLPSFLEDFCFFDTTRFTSRADLFNAYLLFLVKTKKRPVTMKEFNTILIEEGYTVRRTSKRIDDEYVKDYFIENLALKEDWKDKIELKNRNKDKNEPEKSLDTLDTLDTKKELDFLLGEKVGKKRPKRLKCPKIEDYSKVTKEESLVCFNELLKKQGTSSVTFQDFQDRLVVDDSVFDDLVKKLLADGTMYESPKGWLRLL